MNSQVIRTTRSNRIRQWAHGITTNMLDPLTGFWNRSAIGQIVRSMLPHATHNGGHLAVLWLDIDRFHRVNQALGHKAGDRVLTTIARRLLQCVKAPGRLVRVGNDEFVALIPDCTERRAVRTSRQMLQAIRSPVAVDGRHVRLAASAGLIFPRHDEDIRSIIDRANRAKALSRQIGWNRIAYSEDAIRGQGSRDPALRENLSIENILHDALSDDGLNLVYQPIFTASGEIEAAEALLRLSGDRHGISTTRLVDVAEQAGLMGRLGQWSLSRGTRDADRLHAKGFPTRIAINVSRSQIASARFFPTLSKTIEASGVAPHLLEIELTESIFIDDTPLVRANLQAIRQAGIDLTIDDFGTGYSSLSSLRDIPATKIKLDRSFLREAAPDERSFKIIRSFTHLAHELGMRVVAEGIETNAQAEAVIEAGVDALQGFHLAMPMDADDLHAWMDQGRPAPAMPRGDRQSLHKGTPQVPYGPPQRTLRNPDQNHA